MVYGATGASVENHFLQEKHTSSSLWLPGTIAEAQVPTWDMIWGSVTLTAGPCGEYCIRMILGTTASWSPALPQLLSHSSRIITRIMHVMHCMYCPLQRISCF